MEPTNQGEVAKQADKLSHVIQTDEGKIQTHLGEVVRGGRDTERDARRRGRSLVPCRTI
jgi:hypothetical protein